MGRSYYHDIISPHLDLSHLEEIHIAHSIALEVGELGWESHGQLQDGMLVKSYAFHHSINKIRQYLRVIFTKALLSQVDFITGDFNLFCNRQFSTDLGWSVYGGIALEVLDDAVKEMNKHLLHYITYNVSSSTPAKEVFEFMQHGNVNANLDCMLCISVFYNKQRSKKERPPILVRGRELAHDYLHNILERPRQLSNHDLCLRQTDCDWHRPLIVRLHAFHLRNLRTRGPAAQQNRGPDHKALFIGGVARIPMKMLQNHPRSLGDPAKTFQTSHWYNPRREVGLYSYLLPRSSTASSPLIFAMVGKEDEIAGFLLGSGIFSGASC